MPKTCSYTSSGSTAMSFLHPPLVSTFSSLLRKEVQHKHKALPSSLPAGEIHCCVSENLLREKAVAHENSSRDAVSLALVFRQNCYFCCFYRVFFFFFCCVGPRDLVICPQFCKTKALGKQSGPLNGVSVSRDATCLTCVI